MNPQAKEESMLKEGKVRKPTPWAIIIEGSDIPPVDRDLMVKQIKEWLWNRYGRKTDSVLFEEGDNLVGSYYTNITG